MIAFWERRELFVTRDVKRQMEIRDILTENHIDYVIRVRNRSSFNGDRARMGSLGEPADFAYEYKIYVKKQDLEAARYLLRSNF